MKYPSKKHAEIMEAHDRKRQAVLENDAEGFAAAVRALKEAELKPDTYLCICCGSEFGEGPHADLLVASIVIFGKDGEVESHQDYGITSVTRNTDTIGRRFKVCGHCMKQWKHHPLDYAEMR